MKQRLRVLSLVALCVCVVVGGPRNASAQFIVNPPQESTSYSGFDRVTALYGWYSSGFIVNENAVEGTLMGCGPTGVLVGTPLVQVPTSRPVNTPFTITVGSPVARFAPVTPPNFSWKQNQPLVGFYALPCGAGPFQFIGYALHVDIPDAGVSVNFGCEIPTGGPSVWELPTHQQTVQFASAGNKAITATSYLCNAGTETAELAGRVTYSILVGPPPTLSVSPASVNVSTGDTNRIITTTSNPATAQFAPQFTGGTMTNPNSSCAANLSFSFNGGTGTVPTTVTAGAGGCGRIAAGLVAWVNGVSSSNSVKVVVPPQVMVQTILGEAGGQPGDIDQQALLSVGRNRFGDSAFPGGTAATWQAVLVPGQFYGASDTTPNGPDQELANAAKLFTGEVGDIVGGCKCYWSPTNAEWAAIQTALASGTKTFPSGSGASSCWGNQSRQIVVKASVGLNVSGGPNKANAPAFVFMRLRAKNNDPAVVQIQ